MTPTEHFEAGQLTEAVDAAIAAVKKDPLDAARRVFLCELLCFAGNLERADKQLETVILQEPKAIAILSFRQLLRAGKARQECFADGRVPEFLGEPTPALQLHLRASIMIREGDSAQAAQLLQEAEETRPKMRGTCDGESFDDLRDVDDMTASFFEVLTSNGKYFWIPTERVRLIEFRPPEVPRDLIWRRAHMVVQDGPDGEIFIPALYWRTDQSGDNQLQMGRATDWQEDGELVRGVGQRTYLIGEKDRGIMEISEIEIPEPRVPPTP